VSIDADPASVRATRRCWEQAGRPETWTVTQGSILDREFLRGLGRFDIVYAWGVLHHTGRMWEAIGHAFNLAETGGRVWISIYTKGPKYPRHLAMKRRFNAASALGKWCLLRLAILRAMAVRIYRRQNPFTWNQSQLRGMNVYHDLVDWLGGLPYEVASADEVVQFAAARGLVLERIKPVVEGRCSTYVFRRTEEQGNHSAGAMRADAA
jgi:2-polyprenyl-6-hydroxyphenyl methylase/3-demethylubiquinone-9 3-methyltransferase